MSGSDGHSGRPLGNENSLSPLGRLLKSSMSQQSLSIRKLSKITGICTATISRVINGKQAANINHLQIFSKQLNIPLENLLSAIGVDDEKQRENNSCSAPGIICDIFKSFDIDLDNLIRDMQKELNTYEQYAKTEEGKSIIRRDFKAKIAGVNGTGKFIEQLILLYERFCSEETNGNEQAIIGSALLYFILSTDIIPDYIFPIGFFDDAIAVNLVMKRLALL